MPESRDRRLVVRYFIWTAAALLAAGAFTVATPYVFLAVGRIRSGDWVQFSNEGQAYGGVAAVIGMLAIVGVVASLILQARESTATHVQMERTFHADLLNRAFDDPELIECWGEAHGETVRLKQLGYVNMIVSHWFAMFEIGRMGEPELHRVAAEIFSGMPARDYWPGARSTWLEPPSRRNLSFVAVMDEEYDQAVARGPVDRWPRRRAPRLDVSGPQAIIGSLAVGSFCGAALAGAAVTIFRDRFR